jgi:hypothetical protein
MISAISGVNCPDGPLSLAAPGRPNGANLTMRPVGEGGSDDLPMAHQLPGAICGARRAATPRMPTWGR